MLLLNQTLTSSEREAALQAAIAFKDEYLIVKFRRPEDRQTGDHQFPLGCK